MDKCREEFERSKTFKYFYSVLMHFDEELNCYSSNNSLRVRDAELLTAAWWSFQEQQAKVEELQTLYTQQGINMLKMQKRVDTAIRLLVEAELYQSEPNIDLAVKTLKGDQYDEHRKKAEEAISKGASLTNHRIEL
ncbi:hypothetical protein SOI76_05180 [Acinetobacter pittii]|uniref:hypothetical protein n=1 Tax=Acinetobacter pittii TaxID=48296 RepID=UPI000CE3DB17|nr:hypothetical protein [Acinetobacter pittii]PPC08159.1 hypothetical protein ApiMCR8900_03825 [Acinetobacter pittii]WPP60335.1 hypothetical protein SOI76_05180 [Acinetobacter pittii]